MTKLSRHTDTRILVAVILVQYLNLSFWQQMATKRSRVNNVVDQTDNWTLDTCMKAVTRQTLVWNKNEYGK